MPGMDSRENQRGRNIASADDPRFSSLVEIIARGGGYDGDRAVELHNACCGLLSGEGISALGLALGAAPDGSKRRASIVEGLAHIASMHGLQDPVLDANALKALRRCLGPLALEGRADDLPIEVQALLNGALEFLRAG